MRVHRADGRESQPRDVTEQLNPVSPPAPASGLSGPTSELSGEDIKVQREKVCFPRLHSMWQGPKTNFCLMAWLRPSEFWSEASHSSVSTAEPGAGRGRAWSHGPLVTPFPGRAVGARRPTGDQCCPLVRVWKAEGNGEDGGGGGVGWGWAKGESAVLTFIAGDQRPAFGLEVGRDDVTETMGQDVVCFIVDVLPAVGTGLRDREGSEQEVSPSRSQTRAQATPGGCAGGEGQRSQKATLPPAPPQLCARHCLGHQQPTGASPRRLLGSDRKQTCKLTRVVPSAEHREGKTWGYGTQTPKVGRMEVRETEERASHAECAGKIVPREGSSGAEEAPEKSLKARGKGRWAGLHCGGREEVREGIASPRGLTDLSGRAREADGVYTGEWHALVYSLEREQPQCGNHRWARVEVNVQATMDAGLAPGRGRAVERRGGEGTASGLQGCALGNEQRESRKRKPSED